MAVFGTPVENLRTFTSSVYGAAGTTASRRTRKRVICTVSLYHTNKGLHTEANKFRIQKRKKKEHIMQTRKQEKYKEHLARPGLGSALARLH